MNDAQKLVKRLIKRFGSEQAVADRIGYKQPTINRLKLGRTRNPSYALVRALEELDDEPEGAVV